MPRSTGFSVQNQFVRGLITEATGYNFPEDAATATENCVFEKTGEVRRRLGIDFEDGYKVYDAYGSGGAISEYIWRHVGEDGRKSFVCIQLGSSVSFFEVDADGNVGENKKDFFVNLETYKIAGAPDTKTALAQFTSGFGYLFISHPYCDPVRVEYSFDDDDITNEVITVEIRDVEGVDDGLAVTTRPNSLSTEHKYNLYNQGWSSEVVGDAANGRGQKDTALAHWILHPDPAGEGSKLPSNADIWWLYNRIHPKRIKNEFDPDPDQNVIVTASPAPKGHYVLYAFNQQRSTVIEGDYAINRNGGVLSNDDTIRHIGSIDNVTSGYNRPGTIAFYAGRVWYAGVKHNKFAQQIYFSQVLEDVDKAGKCFSHNDPTGEDFSDLLDTDGGTIRIAEAAEIVKLVPVRNQLLVMATNGVWAISGGQGTGFLASDYAIDKISDIAVISHTSVVTVEGMPQWWNYDGIYGVFPDEAGISLRVRSLSDDTIRSYYVDETPVSSRRYAKGAYNPITKIIQWVWRSTTASTFTEEFDYDRILNLNILTGAYYPWTLNDDDVDIAGIFCIDNTVGILTSDTVETISGDTVVDSSGNDVTISANVNSATESKFKYILNAHESL